MVKALDRSTYSVRGGRHYEPATNRILAALPQEEYQYFFPELEYVPLKFKQVVYEPNLPMRFVYFPSKGIICEVAVMSNGGSVEVGIVGNEGFVGTPILLGIKTAPHSALVQVAGDAFRVKPAALEQVLLCAPRLELILRRFVQARAFQVAQSAACNRLHEVQERLARWLLMAGDRVASDLLPLTHELLAEMLGSRRSTVTVAAGILQRAGFIQYDRGRVRIIDRRGLENTACECYQTIKQYFERSVFV